MNNTEKMLMVYLRRTNGKGEQVMFNPETPIRLFYLNVLAMFHSDTLQVYLKGMEIDTQSHSTIGAIGVAQGDIFHLRCPTQVQSPAQDSMEVQVFYQGSIFSYKTQTPQQTLFLDISTEIVNQSKGDRPSDRSSDRSSDIPCTHMVIFLGRSINLSDPICKHGLRSGDMLSLYELAPAEETPKCPSLLGGMGKSTQTVKVESVTLATSDQKAEEKGGPPLWPRQILMKSSHESRQLRPKDITNLKRSQSMGKSSKKEGQIKQEEAEMAVQGGSLIPQEGQPQDGQPQEGQPQEGQPQDGQEAKRFEDANSNIDQMFKVKQELSQSLDLLNHCWLSSKKVIETQSINCDEEEEDDVMLWLDCKISFQNQEHSHFFTLDCSETTTFQQVWQAVLLRQIQSHKRVGTQATAVQFNCSDSRVSGWIANEETWPQRRILGLAQDLGIQQLPTITFSYICK